MERKIAGVLGAVAALGALNAAQAAPTPAPAEALSANSFAELLEPIPNAASVLKTVDESPAAPSMQENVQLAQFYYHHHHHHHHHHFWRRYRHHHHHHHHHHGYYRYY